MNGPIETHAAKARAQMTDVRSFCRICTANCGILATIEQRAGQAIVVRVRGDSDHPVSNGYTCVKGRIRATRLLTNPPRSVSMTS
jgi:anaerobic selenocysteine-containing dehydrogenase